MHGCVGPNGDLLVIIASQQLHLKNYIVRDFFQCATLVGLQPILVYGNLIATAWLVFKHMFVAMHFV